MNTYTSDPNEMAIRLIDTGELDLAKEVLELAKERCPHHPISRAEIFLTEREDGSGKLIMVCEQCQQTTFDGVQA